MALTVSEPDDAAWTPGKSAVLTTQSEPPSEAGKEKAPYLPIQATPRDLTSSRVSFIYTHTLDQNYIYVYIT